MGSICKINAVKMNELITFWQIFLRKEKRWTSYNLQCFLISVFKHLKFNVLKLNQNYWSCFNCKSRFLLFMLFTRKLMINFSNVSKTVTTETTDVCNVSEKWQKIYLQCGCKPGKCIMGNQFAAWIFQTRHDDMGWSTWLDMSPDLVGD